MEQRFREGLAGACRIEPGSRVLLAVSGGPDSMAMLHLFSGAREALALHLEAVHFHHGIRGEAANQDAAFVEEACASLQVPFRLFRFDVPQFALAKGLSGEEAGRRIRSHFFLRYAALKKMSALALAHTADDQAETVLLNFFRGAGVRGLAGMAFVRGKTIRPLLGFSKKELLAFLQDRGILFRVDATNDDLQFTRNKMRGTILPFLEKELSGDLRKNLLRAAEVFREEETWMEEMADVFFRERVYGVSPYFYELKLSPSEHLPVALERRLLRKLVETAAGTLEGVGFLHIEQLAQLLRKETGKRFEFSRFIAERTPTGISLSEHVRIQAT